MNNFMKLLFLVIPAVYGCCCACFRRNLGESGINFHKALPAVCTEPNASCDNVAVPNYDFFDFSKPEDAQNLVAHYCCLLRDDDVGVLYSTATSVRSLCQSDHFLVASHGMSRDEMTAAQIVLATYCPESLAFRTFGKVVYSELWDVVSLGFNSSPQSMLQCQRKPSQTSDKVRVIIQNVDAEYDLQHVSIQLDNGDTFGWTPENGDYLNSFDIMNGVRGKFVAAAEVGESDLVWEVSNVDVSSLLEKKKFIESVRKYSLLEYNCPQVALDLLAAGLHCTTKKVPFLAPAALFTILDKVGKRVQGNF